MAQAEKAMASAGEIFVRRLAENGVDYLFANGGTDFAPVIEGLARAAAEGFAVPQAVVIPHETAAVGMAHGYYLATGRPQAVMVHTNVGLANCVMGAINAASGHVPMILASGMTPVTEQGPLGHRNSPISWGQDMRDQVGMLRNIVKWDGTLLYPEQMADFVDRAFAAAMSHPRGPVYLGLPREALCATAPLPAWPPRNRPASVFPDPDALAEAARLLDAAERPLIIINRLDENAGTQALLKAFVERHAIALVQYWPSQLALAPDSPMHAGFDPGADLGEADVVLVLDTTVPWLPHRHAPAEGAVVIQAGPDPYHLRTPIRGFAVDIPLTGSTGAVLAALDEAMPARDRGARFARLAARHQQRRDAGTTRRAVPDGVITAAFAARAIAQLVGTDGRIVSELGARADVTPCAGDQFHASPISGGLGWGLPTALGVQLADRERLVVATLGDGSYMFSNPVACHQIAEALDLPLLTVVFNNGIWNAVRSSTLMLYPDGHAARANRMPITSLEPAPDYCKVAQASRAWTARVENAHELADTLAQAARVIREERRQALVEIVVQP